MRTSMLGCWLKPWANWSRIGRKLGRISERPESNEISLGMLSLSWLSAVCVTTVPVPAVACSMARFLSSMLFDQT